MRKLFLALSVCVSLFVSNNFLYGDTYTLQLEQPYPSILIDHVTSDPLEHNDMWQLIYSEDDIINDALVDPLNPYGDGGFQTTGNDHIILVSALNDGENYINAQVDIDPQYFNAYMYIRFYNTYDPISNYGLGVRWGETEIVEPEEVGGLNSGLYSLAFTPMNGYDGLDMNTSHSDMPNTNSVPEPITVISLLFGLFGLILRKINRN